MPDQDLLSLLVPAASARALTLLVPGGLTRCSGRYRYDRQIVQGLRALGWKVEVTLVDASFPAPTDAALEEIDRLLAAQRDNALVLVDGLVLGAIPEQIERVAHRMTVVGIVHHLLAAETGLDPAHAAVVAEREGQALRAATGLIAPSFGIARAVAAKYGLDKPLLQQYGDYLISLAHGDLGSHQVVVGDDEPTAVGAHDLEAGTFETGNDLPDHVLGHGVGLDDRKGAVNRHEKFS